MKFLQNFLNQLSLVFFLGIFIQTYSYSQCNNVGFESGDFTNWVGTYGGTTASRLDIAPPNSAPTVNNSHCLMTTAGFDAVLGGSRLSLQPPNGAKSMRLGNATGGSGFETISYTFTVDASNTNFTYQYAVVLQESTPVAHTAADQPFFKISMKDAAGGNISCATYDVNSTSTSSIGGFKDTTFTPSGAFLSITVHFKTWSAVTIPLNNYIGQTVTITFETRDCAPGGNPGGHFAYAYLSASCAPLEVLKSAPSVCPGQTVKLTAPAAKAYSWKGPSAGSIVSGATSNIAQVNAPGTYTVTLTAFGDAGCTYDLTADMAQFKPGDGVTVNSETICVGQSVTLTATGGAPYSWSTGATTASITVTPGSTTTYSVTGGTCVSTNTGVVTVNTTPTSTFTGTNVCANVGSTITYTGTGDANSTYTWGFDGGTVISGTGKGPYSVSWPTGGTKNVTLTVANGPCVSAPTTVPVVVNVAPTVTITPATVCLGVSGTLTAAGATTYLWSDGTTSTPALTATPTVTTNYTVTGTTSGCATNTIGTITVNPLQNASFNYSPATVCQLAGGTNPVPTLTGTTGGTYSCPNAGLIINSGTGVIDLQNSTLGTYTVTYTTPGPCQNSSKATINIVTTPKADFTFATYCKNVANPSPTFINGGSAGTFSSTVGLSFVSASTGEVNLTTSTAGIYTITNTINSAGCPVTTGTSSITINAIPTTTVNHPTACSGAAATIIASGATTYLWSGGATGSTYSVTPGSTTTYTVTGTTAGCSSTATSTVTVNANPIVTVQSKTICSGASTTVYASGAATYAWSNGTILDSLVVTAPTANVSYTVTGTKNGCTASAVSTITVNALPVITVNSPAICQGLSGILTPTGGGSYVWSDTTLISIKNITPTASKTYTVYGSTADCSGISTANQANWGAYFTCWTGGCIGNAVSTVTVLQKPVITVNSPTICVGQTTTLSATGGATLAWSNGSSGSSITITPLTSTSYTVSDNTAGCSGSAVSNVIVNTLPVVTVNSSTICSGKLATLSASGAATYSWSNASVANPLLFSPIATANYTVTGTSAAGCIGKATTSVIVNPLPTVTVNSATICEGLSANIIASGASLYAWSNGASSNPLIISPTKTTSYTVTGTNQKGCINTATSTVIVFPKPTAQFNASPKQAGILSPVITFTNLSSVDVNYWHWDFGDGDTLAPKTPNPVHTYPSVETTYTVTLNVLNSGLCPNSISHEVIIGPEYSFYIPNAFSPNGDSINDKFFGVGNGILEYELMIFDRWGNFIFYSDDIDKGWDGKTIGSSDIVQHDTYVWKVNLKDIFLKKHSFIGTVTLIKGE
jgi:gliding motility-associated-like protein